MHCYVTHDQGEALALSDRIVVMSRGRVEQIGSPREIYETPRTRFVADFIGASNLLPGVVESASMTGAVVRVGAARLQSSEAGPEVASGRSVTVLIRPERVRLLPPGSDPPGANVLAGRVAEVVYLGEDLQVTVETEEGLALTVSMKVGSADKELPPGTAVTACIARQDVRVLPAERDAP